MSVLTSLGFSATDSIGGIDVSHYQGAVDWSKVAAAGIQFCYVKASEGIGLVDLRFAANYDASRQSGIRTGAYHFLRAGQDAEKQAESFLHLVTSLEQGDLPPALDIEVVDGVDADAVLDAAQAWLDAVENVLLCRPLIYTDASFWDSRLGGSSRFDDYFLWIANYGAARTQPRLPTNRTDFQMWQFSQSGTVPGISGSVDLNRFNGSTADLDALASR